MRPRGFSLIELVVAVAVSVIVVAAAVALMLGSQRSFRGGVEDRAVQETARVALDELTRSLQAAGYGLEPTFVFDFGQAAVPMDRVPLGTSVRFGGYGCAAGNEVTCRDSVTGPDELVFYARDPVFAKDVTAVGGNGASLTLSGRLSSPLQPGQILQVMCYGANNQWLWAYVQVHSADDTNPLAVAVTLEPATGLPNDFPYQNALLTQPCFGSGTRRAFKIDRYRYYVAAVDEAGAVQDWETPGTRPYLMLDRGLASGPVAIAPDVEDLQVAYVFPLAGAQLAGATGDRLTNAPAAIDLAPASGIPTFATPTLDPLRTSHHPANVRAVRFAVTVRTERMSAEARRNPNSATTLVDDAVPAALNRPSRPGEDGYGRLVFEKTVYIHNMENRLPVFPMYDPTWNAANCTAASGNCGGG